MKALVLVPLALVASAAHAQLAGGVAGSVGSAVNGVGVSGGAGANAAVGGLPDVGGTVGETSRRTAIAATRAGDSVARETAGTRDRIAGGPGAKVRVEGDSSIRVAQGSRCWYEADRYYDPVVRDGYYYCERSGPQIGVSAAAGAPER